MRSFQRYIQGVRVEGDGKSYHSDVTPKSSKFLAVSLTNNPKHSKTIPRPPLRTARVGPNTSIQWGTFFYRVPLSRTTTHPRFHVWARFPRRPVAMRWAGCARCFSSAAWSCDRSGTARSRWCRRGDRATALGFPAATSSTHLVEVGTPH